MNFFFKNQPQKQQEEYSLLLSIIGSLSKIFSENPDVPFLHYRVMENIFSRAFMAENLSRSDISIDASKGELGIGLKTFLYKNGNTLEKVAEFNKDRKFFYDKSLLEIIKRISGLRNKRLQVTADLTGTQSNKFIYHCIARTLSKFIIHESPIDFILIDQIKLKESKKNEGVISFDDGINEYSFNLSKSTLFQRFSIKSLFEIKIPIIDDPFDFLREVWLEEYNQKKVNNPIIGHIELPLYSLSKGQKIVYCRSGLNQWNAKGRPRDPNEVYIPISSKVHKDHPNFFPDRDESFTIKLPNGKDLVMKVCQQGNKALMSNPNSSLGKYLLRDVFKIPEGSIITYQDLEECGINSARIFKYKDNSFLISFHYE